jgi:hypothetical protein
LPIFDASRFCLFCSRRCHHSAIIAYLDLLGAFSAFATGEGDAAALGVAAGLALVAGAVAGVVALLGAEGVDEVDGGVAAGAVVAGVEVVVLGEFELFSGSLAQAAANAIVAVASSASAMRLIRFTFGLVISFFSSSGKD